MAFRIVVLPILLIRLHVRHLKFALEVQPTVAVLRRVAWDVAQLMVGQPHPQVHCTETSGMGVCITSVIRWDVSPQFTTKHLSPYLTGLLLHGNPSEPKARMLLELVSATCPKIQNFSTHTTIQHRSCQAGLQFVSISMTYRFASSSS
jgi:hypothetical protein